MGTGRKAKPARVRHRSGRILTRRDTYADGRVFLGVGVAAPNVRGAEPPRLSRGKGYELDAET